MNEQEFGYKIRQSLNHGLALDASKLDRLKAARETALSHQRASASSPLVAWATEVAGGPAANPRFLVSRLVLPVLVLALGLFVVNYWHQAQLAQENAEIDAEVLTGDLPIDAYLDKGFDAWLRHSSE
jgi:cytochrome c-type biogenesis protein CcmH/NrfG